jgi:hypothetical protein
MTAFFHSYSQTAAALAAIDDPVGFVIDRRHVPGADITPCLSTRRRRRQRREEFVGRWFVHACGNGKLIWL